MRDGIVCARALLVAVTLMTVGCTTKTTVLQSGEPDAGEVEVNGDDDIDAATVDADAPDTSTPATDSGANDSGVSLRCSPRVGNYVLTSSLISGNCGPANPPIAFAIANTTNPQFAAMPAITGEVVGPGNTGTFEALYKDTLGTIEVSADNCSVAYDLTYATSLGLNKNVGTIRWSDDGTSASCTVTFTGFGLDGKTVECAGQYGVTYKKQ